MKKTFVLGAGIMVVTLMTMSYSTAQETDAPVLSQGGYSIFYDTMADMPWTDVEKAAQDGAVVVFPTAGITEHGPHLPTGTDLYEAYMWSRFIKQELADRGVETVIAPPFFWAVNARSVKNWPGSFSSTPETVKSVLRDSLASLHACGFERLLFVSWHTETEEAIMELCTESREDIGIQATFVLPAFRVRPYYRLTGNEEHVVIMPSEESTKPKPKYIAPHAAQGEVGYMATYFPDLVDLEMVKTLEPTRLTQEEARKMWSTPDGMKKRAPGGYVGDPASYNAPEAAASFVDGAKRAAATIESVIKGTYEPPPDFRPYKPE